MTKLYVYKYTLGMKVEYVTWVLHKCLIYITC